VISTACFFVAACACVCVAPYLSEPLASSRESNNAHSTYFTLSLASFPSESVGFDACAAEALSAVGTAGTVTTGLQPDEAAANVVEITVTEEELAQTTTTNVPA
jgi:hypothetical protein